MMTMLASNHPIAISPLSIAIVEDDDGDFLAARRTLENNRHQSYNVTRANSFQAGVALLKDRQFDVALIDYRLGDASGVELMRAVGGRNSRTPLVLISGVGDRHVDLEAMEAGAMDYLEKSELSPDRLERTIRYVRHVNRTLVEFRNASQPASPPGPRLRLVRPADAEASLAPGRDFEHTLRLAAIALQQIAALRHPADPPSFDIWYTYASGRDPMLNQAINALQERKGTISVADIDHIYHQRLAGRETAKLEDVGAKIGEELNKVQDTIDAGITLTTRYERNLVDASGKFGLVQSTECLRKIIESLSAETRAIEIENHNIKDQLFAYRREIYELKQTIESMRTENLVDPLTSLGNRKQFDISLHSAMRECAQECSAMSLLLCDIDHFKQFNDTFGHLVGYHVLRLVGLTIKQSVRGKDVAIRYGGEEIAVILPRTPLHDARFVAEKIREAVTEKELVRRSTGQSMGRITISIGVAQLKSGDSADELVERVDRCLYAAKRNGRNRVVCENELAPD
jgi:diguanylate cyclase